LDALGVYLGDVRGAHGALQARVRDEHGAPYVIPLDISVTPKEPAQWEELARAYEVLIPATEALAWFNEHERALKPAEIKHLLEGVGAAQARLMRLLDAEFCGRDEQQQKQLYAEL